MTLREAAEIVMLRLYGGMPSEDADIDIRQIMVEILMQRDYIIAIESKSGNLAEGGDLDNDLYVTYGDTESTVFVPLYDNFKKQYYMILPAKPLMVRNSRNTFVGIERIYPPDDPSAALVMIERGMTELIPDVALHAEGNLTWELTPMDGGKRVVFGNMNASRIPNPGLAVDMIPQTQADIFNELGVGDKISLPSKWASIMLDRVTQILLPRKGSADKTTDNVDEAK